MSRIVDAVHTVRTNTILVPPTVSVMSVPYFSRHILNKANYLKLQSLCLANVNSGTSSVSALLASHNSRMRCFVESVGSDMFDKYRQRDGKETAYRFKNCATLKVTICRSSSCAIIELIYSGKLNDDCQERGKYFVTPNEPETTRDRCFWPLIVPFDKMGIEDPADDYIVYIVRHGEAEHNLKTYYKNGKVDDGKEPKDNRVDTNLTNKGKEQAKDTGTALAQIIPRIDYVFCSVLKRTRQTVISLFEGIMCYPIFGPKLIQNIDTMYVAPCSREIKFGDVKGCFVTDPDPTKVDADYKFNQPGCSYLDGTTEPQCTSIDGMAIEPKFYVEFHNQNRCTGTSSTTVAQIIDVIKELSK